MKVERRELLQKLATGGVAVFTAGGGASLDPPAVWRGSNEPSGTPAGAVERLSRAFKADPDYAWGWHCNLACAAIDEGADQAAANRIAARFMRAAFSVETERS